MIKNNFLSLLPLCLLLAQMNAQTVIIDNSFSNGNGSFEFDDSGVSLGAPGDVGQWFGNSDTALTIDVTDSIAPIDANFASNAASEDTNSASTDGSFSLIVNPDTNPASAQNNGGGILNTGYTIGSSDVFTFSFDWRKDGNRVGAANFDVFAFTSSNNTISGTLTSIFKATIGSGPATAAFSSESFTAGDFTITGSSIGQQLFVAFAGGGFSGASNTTPLLIDNVSLTAIPEPGTYALLAGFLGLTAVMLRRRL